MVFCRLADEAPQLLYSLLSVTESHTLSLSAICVCDMCHSQTAAEEIKLQLYYRGVTATHTGIKKHTLEDWNIFNGNKKLGMRAS